MREGLGLSDRCGCRVRDGDGEVGVLLARLARAKINTASRKC